MPGPVRRNPKIVSASPLLEAAAGTPIAPNAPRRAILQALERAPELVKRLQPDLSAPIGEGEYALAWDLPDHRVLKITSDHDDVVALSAIHDAQKADEFISGVLEVHEVWELPHDGHYLTPRLWAIVAEYVEPLQQVHDYPLEAASNALSDIVASEYAPLTNWPDRVVSALMDEERREELLAQHISKAGRSKARGYFEQLADGWNWLYENATVAVSDIHAGNVGVTGGGRAVFIDFGHGSARGRAQVRVPLAANRAVQMPRVKASFDRHFDILARRLPDFGALQLHHDEAAGGDNGHGSERQFGFCTTEPPFAISFAAKTEKLPTEYIDGLVAHEMGHAIDFRYGKELERKLATKLPKGVERRADAIAEAVFGRRIEYGHGLIQCVGCGGMSPRPKKLG